MSIEAEALLQEAKESIEAARNYRSELQHRVQGLDLARQQIKGSATQTRAVLVQHFQALQGTVSRLLEERLAALLLEVDAIEQDSIRPLDDCQKLIEQGVSTADELLREGAVFVNGKEMTNQLPAISTGSAVTFDMEVVNVFPVNIDNNEGASVKLRVTIGSGSREVVFDWLLEQAQKKKGYLQLLKTKE
ncbi:UNVERIFIED_CONTAM: hypothetical protein FKN15_014336 [Acipenser sinensis]